MSKKIIFLLAFLGLFMINIFISSAADCATEFGDQGYSCMEVTSGSNCKTGYCPGGNNIQCCQSSLGILPQATGKASDCKNPALNPPYGAYDANYCGDYAVNDFISLAIKISKYALGLVGTLSLIMFIYGGIMFLVSAGSAEAVAKGKKIIIAAVIGLAIVFSSFLIIQFVLRSMGLNWDGTIKIPTTVQAKTQLI